MSFYLEESADAAATEELLGYVRAGLNELSTYMNVGSGAIAQATSDEADWRDNWKEFFSGFAIGNIYIKPTWEEAPVDLEGKALIEIDPGVSFGTGKHESTHLVIEAMQEYGYEGKAVLDVGCGSGILSLVAMKLGASSVTGTDIDADCIASSYENLERNGIDRSNANFMVGNLIVDASLLERVGKGKYDLVFANILADIIIPMAPALVATMKPGAVLITSGIIDFKEEAVAKALTAAGLTVEATASMGEWRSLVCSRYS